MMICNETSKIILKCAIYASKILNNRENNEILLKIYSQMKKVRPFTAIVRESSAPMRPMKSMKMSDVILLADNPYRHLIIAFMYFNRFCETILFSLLVSGFQRAISELFFCL